MKKIIHLSLTFILLSNSYSAFAQQQNRQSLSTITKIGIGTKLGLQSIACLYTFLGGIGIALIVKDTIKATYECQLPAAVKYGSITQQLLCGSFFVGVSWIASGWLYRWAKSNYEKLKNPLREK